MKRKMNAHLQGRINHALEMPAEITESIPKVTIKGFNEMLIENYKGIIEYEDFYIKINTEMGNININGFNLMIEQITEDDLLIEGTIENIDLDRVIDEE